MAEQFYKLDKIEKENAQYNVIFGERSNGKTFSLCDKILKNYCSTGKQGAIIRRWTEDFRGKRGSVMFDALVELGLISKYSDGKWTGVKYESLRWYLIRKNDKGETERDETPFCYGFSLASTEHDKSTSYPNITTIVFDEFLTRGTYLPDEFVLFTNTLSTIIRQRDDVKIYMLGNTVNQYSPYFNEMGLYKIKEQKQGTIDVYQYGESALKVAVEYCGESIKKKKKSDVYFAFDNPKLQMITKGSWELDIYPHLPCKYLPKEIEFKYFIIFDRDILQCEVICHGDSFFTYIHRKTTPIKDEDEDLVFQPDYDPRPNFRRKINAPDELNKKIMWFFIHDKVFYQDNLVGEIVRNYLIWCNKQK